MSSEYSFSVPRVQFMSAEYSLCPQSTVSGSREQFMSLVTVNVPRVQFKSLEDSFCPQSTFNVSRVQFMSPE